MKPKTIAYYTLITSLSLTAASCSPPATSETSSQPETPSLPIYAVNWQFCADTPNAIIGADSNGCVQNQKPIYVWSQDTPYQPQAILLRTSIPTALASQVSYQVAISSNGCFLNNPDHPQEAGFYSANQSFFLNKNFAANRQIISEVTVDAKKVSTQELKSALTYRGRNPSTFGRYCQYLNITNNQ